MGSSVYNLGTVERMQMNVILVYRDWLLYKFDSKVININPAGRKTHT